MDFSWFLRIANKKFSRLLVDEEPSMQKDMRLAEKPLTGNPDTKEPTNLDLSAISLDSTRIDHKLAAIIDHTLLKPEATTEDLIKICNEAKKYGFATVCVNSCNIPLVAKLLKDSSVKPIAVVGFPLGAVSSFVKALEASTAITAGAAEIDMVINLGALKSNNYQAVYDDIKQVVAAVKPYPVKVIIETALLHHDEKVAASVLAKAAGATFIKTSTGFAAGGATIEDLKLIRSVVGEKMLIKASGGIKTKEDAEKMIAAGANRIGASASIAIVTRQNSQTATY